MSNLAEKILDLESQIRELPRGTLTYKNIKGKRQPYLQWKEEGKVKSKYIKVNERDAVLAQIEERGRLQSELIECLAKYYNTGAYEVREGNSFDEYNAAGSDAYKSDTAKRRTVAIGAQDFEYLRKNNLFYIDKTGFIKEWWDRGDSVTLITRPRRFGKTLMLNTVERFFSARYKDQAKWFEGLSIWQHDRFRQLQGTLPVIFLSLAGVKESTYEGALSQISWLISDLYRQHDYLLESEVLNDKEKNMLRRIAYDMEPGLVTNSINQLAGFMYRHFGCKVVILLDEYDTPMHEAYASGYWTDIASLFRSLYNAAFKTNPYIERALMTGITRISRESMFSDLNNLRVVTTTTDMYTDAFGFTESEVFAALDEYGYTDKEAVRFWYDGFIFGNTSDIYNPWSVINYLSEGRLAPYWSNTSNNSLASKLISESPRSFKLQFEDLLQGRAIHSSIDEQIVFGDIKDDPASVWSLLLAAGYLKVTGIRDGIYELDFTNHEVRVMFENMVRMWFNKKGDNYNEFIDALLKDDLESMNYYMNNVAITTFSYFDTGSGPGGAKPEKFYHGFVLGLMIDLRDRYIITSNRESGLGRYDVQLQPRDPDMDDAILIEFKIHDPNKEGSLQQTIEAAHDQIESKGYARAMKDAGIPDERIRKYGFAFRGKEVLIG